jgi:hypothetical protein
VGKEKQERVAAAPRAVREIAWKAQCRLSARYRALTRKGKLKTVAVTAVARELKAACSDNAPRLSRGRNKLGGAPRRLKGDRQ